jgi:hypothetical protein
MMKRSLPFVFAAFVGWSLTACDDRPETRGKVGTDRALSQRVQTDTPPPHGGMAQRPGEDSSAAAAATPTPQ